jgi:Leucine-rich repeat (LRR) protein
MYCTYTRVCAFYFFCFTYIQFLPTVGCTIDVDVNGVTSSLSGPHSSSMYYIRRCNYIYVRRCNYIKFNAHTSNSLKCVLHTWHTNHKQNPYLFFTTTKLIHMNIILTILIIISWTLTNLNFLDISQNQLTTLGLNIFNNLNSLSFLNMSSNQFTSFSTSIFRKLTSLTILDLSKNKLKGPLSSFANLTKLTTLDLSYNQVGTIDSRVFSNINNVAMLAINLKSNASLAYSSGKIVLSF